MSSKRIFITGGASGLGRALAARYARDGWRVCVGDIDATGGAATVAGLKRAEADAHFLRCDVTRDEDLEAAAAWLERSWGGVDVVVNNAGVAVAGRIADIPLADWQWIVDINLLGVVRGCRTFTPMMRRQGGGHLVNIASMAGLVHAPLMAPYNATKAAVVALSETLRAELAPDHIHVSVVCPAFFRTAIAESARAHDPTIENLARRLVGSARRGPEDIADLVARGITRRDFHIITHREARIAWLLKRYAPTPLYGALFDRLARRVAGNSEGTRAA
jgi:NAD(P)-dependent dehydrogenase (short-subunit alcohol dehydrogenase family)